MKILCLDFETKDMYLDRKIGMGPGWVYALHNPTTTLFKVIGFSYHFIEDGHMYGTSKYLPAIEQEIHFLKTRLLKDIDGVVMHNAQYDLGCLRALGIDIKDLKVYDTKVIGHLYDNNLMSYSLASLAEKYLGEKKGHQTLIDLAKSHPEASQFKETNKTYESQLLKWAYQNMDKLQEHNFKGVAEYANQDTLLTAKLFLHYNKRISLEQAHYFSNFQLICTVMREKGIKVDMKALDAAIESMTPEVLSLKQEVWKIAGEEFNLASPKQLTTILLKKGYKLPKTAAGNPSADNAWLVEQEDEFCTAIKAWRTADKILGAFFVKVRDIQQYTCPEALCGEPYGRVFPELNVFGAATGRFSSSSPNIQQIPMRHPVYGPLCRSIYVPDNPENKWISCDWSNQEGRLQLHYALAIQAYGAQELADEFHRDPAFDMHQKIADMMGVTRSVAKGINLGLSYGMGEAKLCKILGLPTQIAVNPRGKKYITGGVEAKRILSLYKQKAGYLLELNDKCMKTIKEKGGIRTIGGRFLLREADKNGRDFDYKALNKLVQGGSADQCLAALKLAYETGLNLITLVHDEIAVEGKEFDAKILKHIMETVIQLKVPVLAEVKMGTNWGHLSGKVV